jgi:hypothetical protein
MRHDKTLSKTNRRTRHRFVPFSLLLVALVTLSVFSSSAQARSEPTGASRPPANEEVVFIPANSPNIAQTTNSPLPTGTVTIVTGPTDCSGLTCYEVKVTCAGLFGIKTGYVRIGEPSVPTFLGTILFANGGTGVAFWGNAHVQSARVLTELRAAGYRTVEFRWKQNWYQGAAKKQEGLVKLSCRPATLARWVYDTIHNQGSTGAFCAYGHSNGASAVAYSMTQYGLGDILDVALLNGGPNWARNDIGCIQDDPAFQPLWFDIGGRKNVDRTFGYPTNGTGPCTLKNPAYRDQFYYSSLVSDQWQYVYPTTMLAFLFGGNDAGITANHGRYFYDTVVQAGTPLVRYDVVAGAGHNTYTTVNGANAIRDVLLTECFDR